jgi:hypothetical protein
MRHAIRVVVACLFAFLVLTPSARIGAQGSTEGSRFLRVRSSLLGRHFWYQQTYRGVDVLGGVTARHVHNTGDVVTVDRRLTLGHDINVVPSIPATAAVAAAGPYVVRSNLAIMPGPEPRLVWIVFSEPPTGTLRTLVDAQTAEVVSVERIARDFNGTGRVFNPNPVVTLRDPTLRDEDDADYPALAPAYRIVTLTHLDGSGFLRGDFARIAYDDAQTAYSGSNDFDYGRSSTYFSQTMAYYHITTAQEYIQSLGFTDVNNEPQDVFPDAVPDDNSFYSPASDAISLGTGGVDDAEDADIILHEYGHAIQDDQVPGFYGATDANAIGEGFSDYWAVTMSQPVNGGYDVACMGDWDAVGRAGLDLQCDRRVDLDITVDNRLFFEEHWDGQIWSRALWDVNQALGRDIANTIVLEAQFAFSPRISFDEAARITVDTARRLFGGRAARVVYDAFARRGVIQPPNLVAQSTHPPSRPGFREIARLDEARPESLAPGGGQYTFDFEPYDLDDSSNALYAADVTTGGEGVFVAGHMGATEVVRSGDPAPGGGLLGAGVWPGPSLNGKGDVALSFALAPISYPYGRNSGVYVSSHMGTRAVVVPGVTPAPTGGAFVGTDDMTSINSSGMVAFSGMIPTNQGISGDLGVGVFLASPAGDISTVAAPGDPAPGGGTFDFATEPAMNDIGDIAFAGHVAGTPCLATIPQSTIINCVADLFVRRGRTGTIARIAGVGQPAPGGGVFADTRYPVINNGGDVLFLAVVNTDSGPASGYFLSRGGETSAIARPGDSMPGGGHFTAAAYQPGNWDLNDRGDVAFSAGLDSHDNLFGQFGLADQGLYTWRDGVLSLVVRSGDGVPGGEEIVLLEPLAGFGDSSPFSGAQINNLGEVLFQALVVGGPHFLDCVLYVKK